MSSTTPTGLPFARGDQLATPIPKQIVEEAAAFFVRLQSEADNASLADTCAAWRAAHPHHESAWQRVCTLMQLQPAGASLVPQAARFALESHARRRERRKLLALVFAAGGTGVLAWSTDVPMRVRTTLADYRTGTGESRRVVLEDGTILQLDTQTSLNIDFTAGVRHIRLLAGEVMVTSGVDAMRRPLVLATRFGTVTPMGTRFSVRDTGGDFARVQLFEGMLELRPAHGTASMLYAGQQARLDGSGVHAVGVLSSGAGAWTEGTLIAERMPLGDCLAELARYRPGILRCDPAVAGRLVSGAFPLDRSDQALDMIERVFKLRVVYRTRYWVTVTQA